MIKNLSREEEQRGSRKLMMWGAAALAVIFVALMVFAVFGAFLGQP